MDCIASVWISMPLFSRNNGDVAIVWKLEQSTSFPVEHHCERLNNGKQTSLTRPPDLYSTHQMISLDCFQEIVSCIVFNHQSAEQMNIIEECTDRHLSTVNSSSLRSHCGLQNMLEESIWKALQPYWSQFLGLCQTLNHFLNQSTTYQKLFFSNCFSQPILR